MEVNLKTNYKQMQANKILISQQKKAIVFLATIIILVTSMAVIGVTGNYIGGMYRAINAIFLVASLIAIYLTFLNRRMHTRTIMIAMLFILELGVCTESIYCSYNITPYFTTLIVANMTMLAIILLISLFAYLPPVSYLLALLTIVTYTYCAYITNDKHLWALYVIFVILFAVGGVFSYYFTKGTKTVIEENAMLKVESQKMLSTFGINKVELKSYIDLAKEDKNGDRKALDLLDVMGNDARETLKSNVTYLVEQDKIEYDKIHEFIPEFTKSEVAIARLIVEGKKVNKIAEILKKKESNVTCQRTKMRAKLNLTEHDNLRDAIIKRISVDKES